MRETLGVPLLKLMVVILDRNKVERISDMFQKDHIGLQYMLHAQGTANSEIMDLLGLGRTDKAVVLYIGAEDKIAVLLKKITKQFKLNLPGMGVAFTIPINGTSGAVLRLLGEDPEKAGNRIEKEVDRMQQNSTHDLVVAVINQGFSEELMTAAKTAGARGGTVIHARRIANEEAIKFFGITIQEDKEIVAIVATRESKHGIMKAISQACGMKTEAHGIVISLPVDGIAGLPLLEDEPEEDL